MTGSENNDLAVWGDSDLDMRDRVVAHVLQALWDVVAIKRPDISTTLKSWHRGRERKRMDPD